ncbi:MAG: glycosyltransferase [Planctomycetes bacterium]|nr:glycosyltransferase [Planctomycetota bacterium]MCC7396670.1 glycosyltransferase [Planctomycetota bacterium]
MRKILPPMDVRLIYNHIDHHAAHSGYDQLAKYVEGRPWQPDLWFKLAKQAPKRWLESVPSDPTNWYWGQAYPRDLSICLRNALLPAHTLYHFLYAENDVRRCSRWRWRWNNRIVASFHQPPEFLDKHVEDKGYIRGLDAAVVMADFQIDYMARFLPRNRVFCVPHGVDIDYWQPAPANDRWPVPTFVFVGFWLRDVDMAKATIRRVAELGLPARFRIVTFPDRRQHFEGLPQTELLSSISDEQLREEYRKAHALFLPLKLSTANNVVLEAMSCGTGVLSTRIGGVPEYVSADAGLLFEPGDIEGAAAAVRRICENRDLVNSLGKAARQRAETYSWQRMGALQNEVYKKVLRGRYE